jgi:HAD superfamily hydrolase (TIGR01484 family)
MGKPYLEELKKINQTYEWALSLPIDDINRFIRLSNGYPLIVVGSGGSLTAAHMAALLHDNSGVISKAITPYDLIYNNKYIRYTNILFLSAGGSNPDVLSAFRFAALSEPRQLSSICMKNETPLEDISKEYKYTKIISYDIPSGKDGFLATNSLIAFIILLIRAYNDNLLKENVLDECLFSISKMQEEIEPSLKQLLSRDTWIVLYGGWGQIAAVDIESKFTEAGLGNIQLADYRNFAHGRHHWIAKRGATSGILTIITPDEELIAKKTMNLIPKDVPICPISTNRTGPLGGLELLIKILYVVYLAGIYRNIDPGKPGVPSFGSRIYNLSIPKKGIKLYDYRGIKQDEAVSIIRKSKCLSLNEIDIVDLKYWRDAYKHFINKLTTTAFGSIVFDYDGTLCETENRYMGLSDEMGEELNRLLSCGIILGIATGRGQSVRKDLEKVIDKKYFKNVLVGYYNGSDIGFLDECNHPEKSLPLHNSIYTLNNILKNVECYKINYESRPKQITIELNTSHDSLIKSYISEIIKTNHLDDLKIVESGHSLDVITRDTSKINLVNSCIFTSNNLNLSKNVLCIGDRGEVNGNDFDMLSLPYSISVDCVSTNPKSCWNISAAGHKGVQSTLEYLKYVKIFKEAVYFKYKYR